MEKKSADLKPNEKMTFTYWIRLLAVYLLFPLLLFVCGSDLAWWQAWVYSVLIVAVGVGGRFWAEKRHPGLMAERMSSMKKAPAVKPWDKILSPLMSFSVGFPLVIVAGMDHRFGWSSEFPLWLILVGFMLVAVGFAFAVWALAENRFFSGVVRIQMDRGHTVCDTGPYKFVRHPGYFGNILPLPGIALALSSSWTLIPAASALIIIVVRTALEDRTLQQELPGYAAYAQKVRYRLFPGIW